MSKKSSIYIMEQRKKKINKIREKLLEKHGEVSVVILKAFAKELLPKKKIKKAKMLFYHVSKWIKKRKREIKQAHLPENIFHWTCHMSLELTRRSFSAWQIVSGKISERSLESITRNINSNLSRCKLILENMANEII